jgi:hypothetical protein
MKDSHINNLEYYVYTLQYPEDYPDCQKAGIVFYVGKGKGKRIFDHEQEARQSTLRKGCNLHKLGTIRKIWQAGKEVVRRKIAFFETEEEAYTFEIALIFTMEPYEHLTNLSYGGKGVSSRPCTEKQKRTLVDRKKAPDDFYTAAQAMKKLDMTERMFHYYVKQGRIQKVIPEFRKEGFYPKEEIDRIARETAALYQ